MLRYLWLVIGAVPAALAAAEPVDYLRDVKPILRERCFACHGALKQEGSLRLDTAVAMRKGGDSGAAIEPSDTTASLLIERVSAADESHRMPPEGQPLTPQQLDVLRRWVASGAKAPADEQAEIDPHAHWAFQPPQADRPRNLNGLEESGSYNPVDAIIAAERSHRQLTPVPPADKRLLLRRVYLDLVGFPPTRAELHAFLADDRPDAYERVVDRLLNSSHYGERWGRHWMDVWRYTDWYGLGDQLRYSQKHLWHWRDWIVESLNADKGYDRMILEMLAADEIAPTDRDALRATGFLARNYYLFNRTTWLEDTVEHTSKAFLGLTMNCAKCHDHKYDPISQQNYYQMRAFFEPHQVRLDALPGETDLEKDGLPRVFDAHPDAPTYLFIRGDAKNPDKSRLIEPGVPDVIAFAELNVAPVSLPVTSSRPALQEFVLRDHLRAAERDVETARAAADNSRRELESSSRGASGPQADLEVEAAVRVAEKSLAAAELRVEVLQAAHAADVAKHQPTPPANLDELVRQAATSARRYELAQAEEAVAKAEQKQLAAKDDQQKAAAEKELAAARKNVEKAEQAISKPGTAYPSLRASRKAAEGPDETEASRNQPYPSVSTGRRTALAQWITDKRNPLTARVAVNHVWLRHFGQPLVEPVTDFGRRTAPPPQQRLLDWLAVEFMENGWSFKYLHRMIVTSQTYRLGSSTRDADESTRAADPNNQFYWRRQPMRMESQILRDSLLRLAGVLDPAIGGPTVAANQGDTVFRRSLYLRHSLDNRNAFLSMFDDADILACYRRSESIVPQQALALANSKVALDMARRLTAQVHAELGEMDDEQFTRTAFETILCVEPTADELAACLEAVNETQAILEKQKHPQPARRARENLVHALFNHNDFITIR